MRDVVGVALLRSLGAGLHRKMQITQLLFSPSSPPLSSLPLRFL